MRHIIVGQVLDKNGEFVTKVLSHTNFELPELKVLRKYIKEILATHVNKVEVRQIMTAPQDSKAKYRLLYDETDASLCHTIIQADPGLLYGTSKRVIAKIWVQQINEDILPKSFAELQQ